MAQDERPTHFFWPGFLLRFSKTIQAMLPYVGPALVLLVFWLLWQDYQHAGMPVTIVYDGHPYGRETHQTTVRSALLDAGLQLAVDDLVTPGLDEPLHPRDVITVQKAHTVLIEADGQSSTHYTHARTPADILAEAGIAFTEHDEILLNGEHVASLQSVAWPVADDASERNLFGAETPLWHRAAAPAVRLVLRRAAILYVDDGGIPTTIYTTATTIGEALREHDIIVFLGDRVSPDLGSRVSTGLRVYLQRSKSVELVADGYSLSTRTRGKTVSDVLAQQRVALFGSDFVQPGEDTSVQDGMAIRVSRVSRATLIEQKTIPFETVWQPAEDIEIDNQRVDQEGSDGVSKRRFHVVYQDGQEVESREEDEWLESEPQTKVMAYGTKIVPRRVETESGELTYWRKVRALATSYSAATSGKSADHPQYGITFTGVQVDLGVVAVDPKVIGLNTSLYVPGYGPGKAADTGGGITGRRVDLGYGDDDLVMWYRWVDVYLLGNPPARDQIRWVLPNWPREER